jgi:hypothetical protein
MDTDVFGTKTVSLNVFYNLCFLIIININGIQVFINVQIHRYISTHHMADGRTAPTEWLFLTHSPPSSMQPFIISLQSKTILKSHKLLHVSALLCHLQATVLFLKTVHFSRDILLTGEYIRMGHKHGCHKGK